jgi:hypothetical protein
MIYLRRCLEIENVGNDSGGDTGTQGKLFPRLRVDDHVTNIGKAGGESRPDVVVDPIDGEAQALPVEIVMVAIVGIPVSAMTSVSARPRGTCMGMVRTFSAIRRSIRKRSINA